MFEHPGNTPKDILRLQAGAQRKKVFCDAARLQLLFSQNKTSNIAGLLTACITAGVFWQLLPAGHLISWFSLYALVFIARSSLQYSYTKYQSALTTEQWLGWLQVAAISSGALWGWLGFQFDQQWSYIYMIYCIAALVSISAAVLLSSGSSLKIYLSFILPVLLPLTLKLYSFATPDSIIVGSLVLFYTGTIVLTGSNHFRNISSLLEKTYTATETEQTTRHKTPLRQSDRLNTAPLASADSNVEFRNLIESSDLGILIHRDWKPLFTNNSFAGIMGFDSVEELLELGNLQLLFANYHLKRLHTYQQLTEADTLVSYEVDVLKKNGALITLQSSVRSIIWQACPAIEITIRDISEQVRALRNLHRVETAYQQIFTTITDASILVDAASLEIQDANPAALELYGYTRENLINKRITELSSTPVHTRSICDQARTEIRMQGIQSMHRHKNGHIFPVEFGLSCFRLEKKDMLCLIVRDTTYSTQTETALRLSEQRFRDFAETAADFFWETNANLRYTYTSEHYQKYHGLSPEYLLGITADEVFNNSKQNRTNEKQQRKIIAARRPINDIEISWVNPVNGSMHILKSSAKPIFDEHGAFQGYRGVVRNVTEAYNLSRQLTYQAIHDSLTGLVNRVEFEASLQQLLSELDPETDQHALCYLDLDQFKIVNDTCGHEAGDELLRQIAILLQSKVRKSDTLARLGGDEFAVIMRGCSENKAKQVAEGLRSAIEEFQYTWADKKFRVGVSIGVVAISNQNVEYAELLRAADSACYAAKDMGRNRVHVYHTADQELAKREGEMHWVARLNHALEAERFRLHFQEITPVSKTGNQGAHYELLLRMLDDQDNLIQPASYLPSAERYNLATKIDRWVVAAAVDWHVKHPEHLKTVHLCAINLSGRSLADEDFMQYIVDLLHPHPGLASKLCFEITETAAIANLTKATRFMHKLKNLGCYFSLDDFGSGLSSFAYLKRLPIDYLKIDGQFVRDIVHDPIALAMVKSINEIGKVMGKQTIAEFVESDAIAKKLQLIGVDFLQGNHIGEARPLDQVLAHQHK